MQVAIMFTQADGSSFYGNNITRGKHIRIQKSNLLVRLVALLLRNAVERFIR